jgi:hypothetical protein
MKRILASGVGLLALSAFLLYQPVTGGSPGVGSSGGLTLAPRSAATPNTPSVSELSAPTETKSAIEPKATGSSGAATPSLRGNSVQPPMISGKYGDDDDGDDDDDEDDEDDEEDEDDYDYDEKYDD